MKEWRGSERVEREGKREREGARERERERDLDLPQYTLTT